MPIIRHDHCVREAIRKKQETEILEVIDKVAGSDWSVSGRTLYFKSIEWITNHRTPHST